MAKEDAATTRLVRREIVRRHIDDTQLHISAMHGVVYIRGPIKMIGREPCDVNQEMVILHRILRSRPGIRDVVIEVNVI